MTRGPFTTALILVAIVVASVMAMTGPATSATNKQCSDAYNRCMDGCDKLSGPRGDGSNYAKCTGKCGLQLLNCSPWKLPKSSGVMQSPTGTQVPPKGGSGLQPVTGVGVKQPEGTSSPKGKVGLDAVNVGDKQIGESTKPPPDWKKVRDAVSKSQLQGAGTANEQPKGKIQVDTGVKSVQPTKEGWGSPSTSGGTIMMQRFNKGKKKN